MNDIFASVEAFAIASELLIEHDMKFVAGLCDEVTVLNFGTTLVQGDTKTALNDPEVIRAYIGG